MEYIILNDKYILNDNKFAENCNRINFLKKKLSCFSEDHKTRPRTLEGTSQVSAPLKSQLHN